MVVRSAFGQTSGPWDGGEGLHGPPWSGKRKIKDTNSKYVGWWVGNELPGRVWREGPSASGQGGETLGGRGRAWKEWWGRRTINGGGGLRC